MEMKQCRMCGHDISPNAETCPNCGEPAKTFWEKNRLNFYIWVFLAIFFLLVMCCGGFEMFRAG